MEGKNPPVTIRLDINAASRIIAMNLAEATGMAGPWNVNFSIKDNQIEEITVTLKPLHGI